MALLPITLLGMDMHGANGGARGVAAGAREKCVNAPLIKLI